MMICKEIKNILPKKNILIVPLDWGLGHATRCIPLIKEFEANGCTVIIAAERAIKSLLEHEFQHITFIPLKGYRINYSRSKYWFPLKIVIQIPNLLFNIYREHRWVKKIVKKYSLNAIIADNRFGLYDPSIPSVYITHQILIKTGNNFIEKIIQKINCWFIKKYTFCWIPDFEGKENIAGELSHPINYPSNSKFIGCLSRFEKKGNLENKYDLLVIISGPEPQRTIFEEMFLNQLQNFYGKALLVRGLPGKYENEANASFTNVKYPDLVVKNHLSAEALNEAILQSKLIITRSGYTTIMDLVKLKQKAILIPTPGQTEQEYLATYLMKNKFFYAVSQQGFILTDSLKQAAVFPFAISSFDMEQYKKNVKQFVESLQSPEPHQPTLFADVTNKAHPI